MFDLIYDFIRNDLIGTSQVMTEELGDHLALLLTCFSIVIIFILLCKFAKWAFNLFNPKDKFWGR